MFSIVIYDNRTKKLFTARDGFAIKPLYYYKDNQKILLSSEIKPLLSYLENTSFEEETFAKFFFKQELDSGQNTFFKGIRNHEPAVYKIFNKTGFKSIKYWKIDYSKLIIKAIRI